MPVTAHPLIDPDWLVETLIERCKAGWVVDREDLATIMGLNLDDTTEIVDYGEAVHKIGKAVVANSGVLIVPDLRDYDHTEELHAPAEWLERWSRDETAPDQYDLGAAFDMSTAVTRDGRLVLVDGPGGHTMESWETHNRKRDEILNERRLRRLAIRSSHQ